MTRPLEYLATPFYHSHSGVRVARLKAARIYQAQLMLEGRTVYCPITALFDLQDYIEDWSEKDYQDYDLKMLAHCDKLLIAYIPGYTTSKGIARETAWAKEHGFEIEAVHYNLGMTLEADCRG